MEREFHSLEEIFEAFGRLKVLIIGDVMIDSYLWGKVERISPEAPVPIINVQNTEQRLGGAANVALNIQAMGATSILCSIIGQDKDGDAMLELLAQNNLTAECIVQRPERITTIKHRVISGSQHLLRIDTEDDSEINEEARAILLSKIQKLIPQVDVVIFEDYDKGLLGKKLIQAVIALAQDYNVPTVVDPKKRNFLCYKGATLFKPNLKELREGLKIDFNVANQSELQEAVALLIDRLELGGALITLSERGMYIDQKQERHHVPAWLRTIADVSGAGDTVVSIAALCLALKLSGKMLVSLANLGGGLVCEYVGVVPIDKNLLFKEAKKHDFFENYAQ